MLLALASTMAKALSKGHGRRVPAYARGRPLIPQVRHMQQFGDTSTSCNPASPTTGFVPVVGPEAFRAHFPCEQGK